MKRHHGMDPRTARLDPESDRYCAIVRFGNAATNLSIRDHADEFAGRYADRLECARCGARDVTLCGHGGRG